MYMVDYAGILASPAILADSCTHGSVYLGWNVYPFICMGLDMNTPLVLNEYRGVGWGENHTETMWVSCSSFFHALPSPLRVLWTHWQGFQQGISLILPSFYYSSVSKAVVGYSTFPPTPKSWWLLIRDLGKPALIQKQSAHISLVLDQRLCSVSMMGNLLCQRKRPQVFLV